jgi:acyl-CoA dehydrogenase
MAAQLSGAMQRCFDMALDQCNTRVQFGKSIGKFQALQQQLVNL